MPNGNGNEHQLARSEACALEVVQYLLDVIDQQRGQGPPDTLTALWNNPEIDDKRAAREFQVAYTPQEIAKLAGEIADWRELEEEG